MKKLLKVSKDVLRIFFSEVQRAADRAVDDDGSMHESIRAAQEQFADAKWKAEEQAEKVVFDFCQGQRKHFKYFIKERRMSDHDGEFEPYLLK
jgi:hypothetical protein